MYTGMDWWAKVRLEVRGESKKREILRSEGIGWETLKKILAHPEPPGYRLKGPRPKPKIGPYLEWKLPKESLKEPIQIRVAKASQTRLLPSSLLMQLLLPRLEGLGEGLPARSSQIIWSHP